jgi:small-conductance mechanosensitive channel
MILLASISSFVQWLDDSEFAGNSYRNWLYAIAAFVATIVALSIVKSLVQARLAKLAERTSTDIDDLIIDLVRRTRKVALVATGAFVAHHWLVVADDYEVYVRRGIKIAMWIQAGFWGMGLVQFGIHRMTRGSAADDPSRTMGASVLSFIGRVFVWSLVLLLSLQAMGQEIGPLLASLGVGGIAVALALQNILGDLFASLAILLDKPFVVGDYIVLGDFMGTVERIGIKTTRLRSLTGEEIVIGNNDLVSSRVRNFKRMRERRQIFTVGVTYGTPREKLVKIAETLREIVKEIPETRLDRAHFKSFGDFSLNFEVVYFVQKPEYAAMMEAQQKINHAICEAFEKEGIQFAFPTQTLHHVMPPAAAAAAQKELSRG